MLWIDLFNGGIPYFNNHYEDGALVEDTGVVNVDSIFKYFQVPENMTSIKDDVIMAIVEFNEWWQPLYTFLPMLQRKIGNWSIRHQYEWEHLYDSLNYEYNPLYNFDRYDDSTTIDDEDTTSKKTSNLTANEKNTENGTNTYNESTKETFSGTTKEVVDDDTTFKENGTTENTVSAYNSSSYSPHDMTTYSKSGSGTDDKTTTTTDNNTTDGTKNSTDTDIKNATTDTTSTTVDDGSGTRDLTTTYKNHSYGKYGIYTYQDLIEKERELVKFNIFDYIANQFSKEFSVKVY